MKEGPLSECTYAGIPNIENTWQNLLITVADVMSGHGKANRNSVNSSVIVRMYLFREADGSGPLKSILSLSKGWVALMRVC